ncbi:uncharacterized protein IAS62_002582 [Cryptococcus decagattii]|uniref:Zn(2)-C6 fungal-type domain-containing protein n=1 Tax=Cryptococcus decagattii TaxID=1859122 RepID=A0ABZ2ARW8_9TREE
MLSHPPSRLSPPPYSMSASSSSHNIPHAGPSATATYPTQLPQTATPLIETKKPSQNLPKRGYRACTNCRLRKARCDLGDVNAPSEPPCSRCRREQRDCVFLPSKRRRRTSVADPALREGSLDLPQVEIYPAQATARPSSANAHSTGTQGAPNVSQALHQQGPPLASTSVVDPSFPLLPQQAPNKDDSSGTMSFTQTGIWNDARQHTTGAEDQGKHQVIPSHATYSTMHSVSSTQHHTATNTPGSLGGSSGASTTALSPPYRSKKRKTEPSNRKIVNASLSNEMDALEILANAATDGDDEGEDIKRKQLNDPKKVTWKIGEEDKAPMRELSEFHLIKAGILDEHGLHAMVDNFFRYYHPALPIFQTARIPRCREQLLDLAHNDSFLLTCIIAVASKHPSDSRYKDVHDRTWAVIRDAMSDYSFNGLPGSVGFVEGVLLLAEHLPRERGTPPRGTSVDMLVGPGTESAGVHGTDNRRSWSLIGLAIRAAYLLGLDQISLEIDESSRTPDAERARSVWTWCYLYDRTIDAYCLAFWSRGPALCFVGYSHISQTGEIAARLNFPLQLSPGAELDGTAHDDSASLMQSLVELTQVMTNAHDILYPSKLRTEVLVKQGEYFLFLDHFRRALDSYRTIWKPKQWSNRTLEELSWMTFHYVRLYISSFGYSAHIKRAQWRGDKEFPTARDGSRQAVQLFPRGSATSPDALYIYDSIAAANEILHIALRLAQMGSLRYLPSRYLINISYAAVFALKSSYSGAVEEKDMHRIRELVDHVCTGLVLSCPDKDHPAVRYGQMLRMLSKRLEELHDASAVPSRYPTPEPIETSTNSNASPQTSYDQSSLFPWLAPANASTENSAPTPAFQLAPFPDMSFLPNSQVNPDYLGGNNAANSEPEAMFDCGDTNFDFDLKGFWDDFTLGEGSGFPFR